MADTPKPPGFWVNQVSGPQGLFGKATKDGWGNAVKDNFVNEWKTGSKGKVFGRTLGTGVGLVMAADAFRSIDANGEERSGLVRLGEGVLGLGITAASLAGGRVR